MGDCLSWLRALHDDCCDAVITDPPYSSGGAFRSDRVQNTRDKYALTGTVKRYALFSGDNRDQRGFGFWCSLWLGECLRIVKPGGVLCMFSDWRQLPTASDALQSGGWVWRGVAVWDKTEAARPVKGRFRNQCEYVLWASRGPMREAVPDCLPGVFRAAASSAKKFHQTGKPESVIADLCRIVPAGGTVCDPFCGGGTLPVVARRLGLDFYACEINPEVHAVAARRVAELGGAVFGDDGAELARQGGLFPVAGKAK